MGLELGVQGGEGRLEERRGLQCQGNNLVRYSLGSGSHRGQKRGRTGVTMEDGWDEAGLMGGGLVNCAE